MTPRSLHGQRLDARRAQARSASLAREARDWGEDPAPWLAEAAAAAAEVARLDVLIGDDGESVHTSRGAGVPAVSDLDGGQQ